MRLFALCWALYECCVVTSPRPTVGQPFVVDPGSAAGVVAVPDCLVAQQQQQVTCYTPGAVEVTCTTPAGELSMWVVVFAAQPEQGAVRELDVIDQSHVFGAQLSVNVGRTFRTATGTLADVRLLAVAQQPLLGLELQAICSSCSVVPPVTNVGVWSSATAGTHVLSLRDSSRVEYTISCASPATCGTLGVVAVEPPGASVSDVALPWTVAKLQRVDGAAVVDSSGTWLYEVTGQKLRVAVQTASAARFGCVALEQTSVGSSVFRWPLGSRGQPGTGLAVQEYVTVRDTMALQSPNASSPGSFLAQRTFVWASEHGAPESYLKVDADDGTVVWVPRAALAQVGARRAVDCSDQGLRPSSVAVECHARGLDVCRVTGFEGVNANQSVGDFVWGVPLLQTCDSTAQVPLSSIQQTSALGVDLNVSVLPAATVDLKLCYCERSRCCPADNCTGAGDLQQRDLHARTLATLHFLPGLTCGVGSSQYRGEFIVREDNATVCTVAINYAAGDFCSVELFPLRPGSSYAVACSAVSAQQATAVVRSQDLGASALGIPPFEASVQQGQAILQVPITVAGVGHDTVVLTAVAQEPACRLVCVASVLGVQHPAWSASDSSCLQNAADCAPRRSFARWGSDGVGLSGVCEPGKECSVQVRSLRPLTQYTVLCGVLQGGADSDIQHVDTRTVVTLGSSLESRPSLQFADQDTRPGQVAGAVVVGCAPREDWLTHYEISHDGPGASTARLPLCRDAGDGPFGAGDNVVQASLQELFGDLSVRGGFTLTLTAAGSLPSSVTTVVHDTSRGRAAALPQLVPWNVTETSMTVVWSVPVDQYLGGFDLIGFEVLSGDGLDTLAYNCSLPPVNTTCESLATVTVETTLAALLDLAAISDPQMGFKADLVGLDVSAGVTLAVAAVTAVGRGELSPVLRVSGPPPPVQPPTDVRVEQIGRSWVSLTWRLQSWLPGADTKDATTWVQIPDSTEILAYEVAPDFLPVGSCVNMETNVTCLVVGGRFDREFTWTTTLREPVEVVDAANIQMVGDVGDTRFLHNVTGLEVGNHYAFLLRTWTQATGVWSDYSAWTGAVGTLVSCGDGSVDATEECDDGNQYSGDGCDSDCTVAPHYTCIHHNDPAWGRSVCYLEQAPALTIVMHLLIWFGVFVPILISALVCVLTPGPVWIVWQSEQAGASKGRNKTDATKAQSAIRIRRAANFASYCGAMTIVRAQAGAMTPMMLPDNPSSCPTANAMSYWLRYANFQFGWIPMSVQFPVKEAAHKSRFVVNPDLGFARSIIDDTNGLFWQFPPYFVEAVSYILMVVALYLVLAVGASWIHAVIPQRPGADGTSPGPMARLWFLIRRGLFWNALCRGIVIFFFPVSTAVALQFSAIRFEGLDEMVWAINVAVAALAFAVLLLVVWAPQHYAGQTRANEEHETSYGSTLGIFNVTGTTDTTWWMSWLLAKRGCIVVLLVHIRGESVVCSLLFIAAHTITILASFRYQRIFGGIWLFRMHCADSMASICTGMACFVNSDFGVMCFVFMHVLMWGCLTLGFFACLVHSLVQPGVLLWDEILNLREVKEKHKRRRPKQAVEGERLARAPAAEPPFQEQFPLDLNLDSGKPVFVRREVVDPVSGVPSVQYDLPELAGQHRPVHLPIEDAPRPGRPVYPGPYASRPIRSGHPAPEYLGRPFPVASAPLSFGDAVRLSPHRELPGQQGWSPTHSGPPSSPSMRSGWPVDVIESPAARAASEGFDLSWDSPERRVRPGGQGVRDAPVQVWDTSTSPRAMGLPPWSPERPRFGLHADDGLAGSTQHDEDGVFRPPFPESRAAGRGTTPTRPGGIARVSG